jgi:hypothetical protein
LLNPVGGCGVKKYDPLWELVGDKVELQGVGEDLDVRCPECHTILHVGPELASGDAVECGLCGAALTIERQAGTALLKPQD